MKKGYFYIIAIVASLFILATDYLGHPLGDTIFSLIGIPPWTEKNQQGFHTSGTFGFLLILVGIVGTTKYFRPQYPKILSRIIIVCIAFLFLFPIVSEKAMFLVKRNSTGLHSMDYSRKDNHCDFHMEEKELKGYCSMTIFNFGDENKVFIKPILSDDLVEIEVQPTEVSLIPHTKMNLGVQFSGSQKNGTGFTGTMNEVRFELQLDGSVIK